MKNVYLIGCTKRKTELKNKAKDLYLGTFPIRYKYALNHNPDGIHILSALYHLVDLETVIDPYDLTLSAFKKKDKTAWAKKVVEQLKEKYDLDNTNFIILAGKNYYEGIDQILPHTELPTKGLGTGYTGQFYKKYFDNLRGENGANMEKI